MLVVKDLYVSYGRVEALKGVSLEVPRGSIFTILGANGAGKSTLLRTVIGLTRWSSGEVWFKGQKITGLATHEIVRLGMAMVPEGRRIFPRLSVLDNLRIGGYLHRISAMQEILERIWRVFPMLWERRNQAAGTLSGGQQQMLAIGRALMSRPELLLLDEPTLGLAPLMCKEVMRVIEEIRTAGITVVLVEQNAALALNLADCGLVLRTGLVVLRGSADELRDNAEVARAYLGG